MYGELYFIAVY